MRKKKLPRQNKERDERQESIDLKARRDARHAKWISIIAVVVTLGVGFASWVQTQRSLDFAETSQRISETAYIGNYKMSVTRFELGSKVQALIEVINGGKTPAKNVEIRKILWLRDTPLPKDAWVEDNSRPVSRGLLTPETKLLGYVESNTVLTKEIRDLILQGKLLVYFSVRVNFEDVFGQHRSEKFCGKFDPKKGLFNVCPPLQ